MADHHPSQPDLEVQPLASPLYERHADVLYGNDLDECMTLKATSKQLFYILVIQGFGAAIIDGIANFAVACAMYQTTRKEIRLWPLEKNTIAGDMGVTVIIQGILTTLITSALVRGDMRTGRIQPLLRVLHGAAGKLRGLKARVWKALVFLSPTKSLSFCQGSRELTKVLCIIILQGFMISVLFFIIFWPLAIAIVAPLYGGIDMQGSWTPEIIKALFGGVLGLFMNPFVAALVLAFSANTEQDVSSDMHSPRIASTTQITSPTPKGLTRIATTTPIVKQSSAPLDADRAEMQQTSLSYPVSTQDWDQTECLDQLKRPATAFIFGRS